VSSTSQTLSLLYSIKHRSLHSCYQSCVVVAYNDIMFKTRQSFHAEMTMLCSVVSSSFLPFMQLRQITTTADGESGLVVYSWAKCGIVKVRQITKQPHLCLLSKHGISPCWPHCPNARRNRCQEYLNSLPPRELERPPGRPCTVWTKTIQQDLKSNNLSLNEAIDMAQNRPLWRLMSTFGTTQS